MWQFFLVRMLTGISVGGCFPLVFSLLGDLFPVSQRAAMSSIVQIAIGGGIGGGQVSRHTLGSLAAGRQQGWQDREGMFIITLVERGCVTCVQKHPACRVGSLCYTRSAWQTDTSVTLVCPANDLESRWWLVCWAQPPTGGCHSLSWRHQRCCWPSYCWQQSRNRPEEVRGPTGTASWGSMGTSPALLLLVGPGFLCPGQQPRQHCWQACHSRLVCGCRCTVDLPACNMAPK